MAGRFLFQKLSSCVSRSRSLPGVHASSAPALLIRPTALDGGIGTFGSFCNGAVAHPSPSPVTPYNRVTGYAARYFNSSAHSSTASKTSSPITGMPPVNMKPALVDSIRGVERIFSSGFSTKNIDDWEAERAALEAALEANKAVFSEDELEARKAAVFAEFAAGQAEGDATRKAFQEEFAAWKAKMDKDNGEFKLLVNAILFGVAALSIIGLVILRNEVSRGGMGQRHRAAARAANVASRSES